MSLRVAAKLVLVIVSALCVGYLCNAKAIQALETAISGAIGAIVGGVLSALAFAFSIMSKLTKESLAKSDSDKADIGIKYNAVTRSLISDVRILIWCLGAAIFLPLYREIDIPKISLPSLIADYFTKSQLVTSLEILLVIVSISVLFEVCNCMFQTLIADSIPKLETDK